MKKPTKSHFICLYLANHSGSTRIEILSAVHALEAKKTPFFPTSNHCYFNGTGRGNGAKVSVVHRGYVQVIGHKNRHRSFAITPKGQKLVDEYYAWLAR